MMDRYLLRYFLAVVDQGNFSRAATHSNVSQPTLSAGIAKLERSLGTQLFYRSNQRVQLTESGTRFLAHAKRIEREFDMAHQAMRGSVSRSICRFGVLATIPGALIASAIADCRAAIDRLVEIIYGSERELLSQLGRGRLDFSLTLTGRAGTRFLEEIVGEEGYCMAMPADHPLAARDEVAAEELANDVMIVRRHCEVLSQTSKHFLERGVRPHFALRSTNDERVLQMVGAGLGVTVMPASYEGPKIAKPKLLEFDLKRKVGFQFSSHSEYLRSNDFPLLTALRSNLKAALT